VYRVCLTLMYVCGLRISEAVCLRPEQIDARGGGGGVIRVIGKRNKERLIPLPCSLLSAMRQVWKTHGNRQCVFALRWEGRQVSVRAVRGAFNAACAREGISCLTPHCLRHGFAMVTGIQKGATWRGLRAPKRGPPQRPACGVV
jgi:site-specific recombinase XerD